MGTSQFLQDLIVHKRELLEEVDQSVERETDPAECGVYLFFSFDISNSTAFKVEYPYLWGSVIQAFYGEVLKLTDTDVYKGSGKDTRTIRKLWKMVGDEVLIQMRVYKIEDLYMQIQEIWKFQEKLMENIIKKVEDNQLPQTNCKGCYGHCGDIQKCIQSMLGVKVTAWLAECDSSAEKGKPNIVYIRKGLFGLKTIDFLGRDIDEGFRIAHEAAKDKLIVSPLLAWMIWKHAQAEDDPSKVVEANFKITAFRKLKGVWNDRLVPIIMYHPKFSMFDELLEYDETQLPVYENLKDRNISDFIADPRFSISRLERIFQNIHRDKENEDIYEKMLHNQSDPNMKELNNMSIDEIHLACAVFTKDNKLLVHVNEKRGLEFGCISWSLEEFTCVWSQACKEGYLKKYNLSIELEENPIAVSTYLYRNDSGKNVQGLILTGNILSDEPWPDGWKAYSKKDIEGLDDSQQKMVCGFKDNALRAFSAVEKGR